MWINGKYVLHLSGDAKGEVLIFFFFNLKIVFIIGEHLDHFCMVESIILQ